MADTKISNLTSVTDVQNTDEYVLARSGTTRKIDAIDLKAGMGVWADYTPTLTAPTTPPTLGSGAAQVGRYWQLGKTVNAMGYIKFGTGMAAGSGQYRFSLPVTPRNSAFSVLGNGWVVNSAESTIVICMASIYPTNTYFILSFMTTVPTSTWSGVNNGTPLTWAAGDAFHWNITYEAA